jgi:hypothetical protein
LVIEKIDKREDPVDVANFSHTQAEIRPMRALSTAIRQHLEHPRASCTQDGVALGHIRNRRISFVLSTLLPH